MPNRRRFHFLAAGLLALAASTPWAAETRTYSDQEFRSEEHTSELQSH